MIDMLPTLPGYASLLVTVKVVSKCVLIVSIYVTLISLVTLPALIPSTLPVTLIFLVTLPVTMISLLTLPTLILPTSPSNKSPVIVLVLTLILVISPPTLTFYPFYST